MEWSISSPALFCLPAVICFSLHILISLGLLVQTRPGFYRFFVFMASSFFFVIYLLLFNYDYTQATTRIIVHIQERFLEVSNQYGTVQIPANSLEAVVVKGKPERPETIWLISDVQTFYLDRSFAGYSSFLPALDKIVKLGNPQQQGGDSIYKLRAGNSGSPETVDYFYFGFNNKNTLRGSTWYYLPLLCLMPFIFYFTGQKAWTGHTRYFILSALVYFLPIFGLAFFFRPSLPLAVFILFYPFYLLLLSAVCLPEPTA